MISSHLASLNGFIVTENKFSLKVGYLFAQKMILTQLKIQLCVVGIPCLNDERTPRVHLFLFPNQFVPKLAAFIVKLRVWILTIFLHFCQRPVICSDFHF